MSDQPSDASELEGAAAFADDESGPTLVPESEQAEESEPASGDPVSDSGDAEPSGPESAQEEGPLDLASVVVERDAYLADLQRVTAEFANFRRQTVKRNTELVAQAASRLARQLLPVLDACEAAVSQGVEGIEAVQSQLLGVLSGEGLAVLGTVGEPFDPGFHEAVMSEESSDDDQAAPVVAQVLRTGYGWNGRVLRPAMVKVRG